MQTITLYRYTREDGGVTTSPVAPPDGTTFDLRYRLVADEGKVLTDGATVTTCADVTALDSWTEIDDPGEMSETEEKAAAFDILMGVSE